MNRRGDLNKRCIIHFNTRMDRVAYIWSQDLQTACDQLPCNKNRSTVVHDLHRAYGLLDDRILVEPDLELATVDRLTRFHDGAYIGEASSLVKLMPIRSHTGWSL
jgi:hypothetical protein